MSFWKKSQGFARLAIKQALEYRVNFVTDALIQPLLTAGIEVLLWMAVFKSLSTNETNPTLAGFGREAYLCYAVWASFVGRVAASWMYEFRMIQEIETGTLNGLLCRPVSFSHYYLSQLLGYKLLTTFASILIPMSINFLFDVGIKWERLFPAMTMVMLYMVLVHYMSLAICSLSFFLTRVGSFTVAKNLTIWLLSGELFPLDIAPPFVKELLLSLPFSSAVYVPVGFLTGRIGWDGYWRGAFNVLWGLALVYAISQMLWRQGLKRYSGTGA